MALDVHALVSYQRAELAKAERLRVALLVLQLIAVAPAVISVFFENVAMLYYLALVSAVFLVLWAGVYHRYHFRRSAGEAARRATYVVGGQGVSLSSEETLQLLDKFDVSDVERKAFENTAYFSTEAPPSSARVGEMLTESAFYSKRIQAECAKLSMAALAGVIIAFGVLAMSVLPVTGIGFQVTTARVFFALLVFLFSYDVFGAIHGHIMAWIELKAILARLEVASLRNYPRTDTFMLIGDYCATMEKAPLSLPHVYDWHKPRLNRLWAGYLEAKKTASSVQSVAAPGASAGPV